MSPQMTTEKADNTNYWQGCELTRTVTIAASSGNPDNDIGKLCVYESCQDLQLLNLPIYSFVMCVPLYTRCTPKTKAYLWPKDKYKKTHGNTVTGQN